MTVLMSEMTWPEYVERIKDGVVILPVGSTEQHAYHLPLGTDSYQANEKCKLIAKEINGIVAPVITYGYKSLQKSGGGQTFVGTTSLSGTTLISMVKDILSEFIRHGAKRIVVFDGHYENAMFLHEGIDLALKEHNVDNVKIIKVVPGGMSEEVVEKLKVYGMKSIDLEHAGLVETSLMLYFRPDLVHMERAVPVPDIAFPMYDVYPEERGPVHESGALSNPTNGCAELGELIVNDIVKNTVSIIKKEFNL
ncbi:putative amidase [Bacillus sp. OxB-1]|uniref:creatininase n=1 Tax=Bacillus sp. (strain OxB-1) TaxID=98228 RepID=UPI00058220C2|nr:creatininase [Bacillus sp. OxB-1]BAQ08897.1 putative amidase [Bacillus sp. OxB-1]